MQLAEKALIVTGGTTGIGAAIAEECVSQGARVLLHGRNEQRGHELTDRLGQQAVFHADDLADPESAPRIVESALSAFGRLDGLVNNAARVVRSDLASTTIDLFDDIMAVNVRAPMLLIQAALPHLIETQGCVANIGSVNALGGERNLLAYSVSKGALLTLSKNLANALAPSQVRVVHFNLGWVLTENEYRHKMEDGLPEQWPDKLTVSEIPSGQMTSPQQVAAVVAFWMSDRSRPFSGTVIELEQYPFSGRNLTREGSSDAS